MIMRAVEVVGFTNQVIVGPPKNSIYSPTSRV